MQKLFACFYLLLNFVVCRKIIVEPLIDEFFTQPFSPWYDKSTNSLYCTEFFPGWIHRIDLATGKIHSASTGNITPAFIIPNEGCRNSYILADGRLDGLVLLLIKWDGISSKYTVLKDAFRANAKKYPSIGWIKGNISPNCEFYVATYQQTQCNPKISAQSALFQHTHSKQMVTRIKGLKLSGGFVWNAEANLFYIIDACKRELLEYKWCRKTGKMHCRRVVHTFCNGGNPEIVPVGLTIDTKGYLYVAIYNAGEIKKINPRTGECELTIELPAKAVADLAFIGKALVATTQSHRFNVSNGGLVDPNNHGPRDGLMLKITGIEAEGVLQKKCCYRCH